MDLQFQFPLLFRFVITSTITMIIERKHQVQSNSIKFNQVSETLRGGRNHTQTACADQIMALGQPPPSCIACLPRGMQSRPSDGGSGGCVRSNVLASGG